MMKVIFFKFLVIPVFNFVFTFLHRRKIKIKPFVLLFAKLEKFPVEKKKERINLKLYDKRVFFLLLSYFEVYFNDMKLT